MWKSIRQAFTDCSKIFGRCGGFNQFIVQDLEYLVPQEHDVNAPGKFQINQENSFGDLIQITFLKFAKNLRVRD